MDVKDYAQYSISDFRAKYIPKKLEINYELIDDKTIKLKIPKEAFNDIVMNLEKDDLDFEVIPSERKVDMKYPRHNGKKQLKTQPFKMVIYFVENAALKTVENLKNNEDIHIKNWGEFFEIIDPEYRNLFKKIIDNIVIALHKDEYNKVISKKTYWLDPNDGLYEKKEKFVNGEWRISYQPVTSNLYQVFRMFFKFFDQVPLKELADFNKFKDIIANTKYKMHLDNK